MKQVLILALTLLSFSGWGNTVPYSVKDWQIESYAAGGYSFGPDSVCIRGVSFKVTYQQDSNTETTLKRVYLLENGLKVVYYVHYYGHEAITEGYKVVFGPPWLTKQL